MAEPLVKCCGVWRSYGGVRVVRNFSMTIRGGEVVVLVGPNGCGKTTAVEMMLGLRKRDEGSVSLLGYDPRSDRAKLAGRVRVTLQNAAMHRQVTVREQMEYLAAVYGVGNDDVFSTTESLEIAGLLGKRFGQLSGGQQRRVMVAGALLGKPEFVVLDEPTSGVDIESRAALWEALRRKVSSSAVGMLVTSHDLHEAELYADRVVIMRAGAIVADDSPRAIIESAALTGVVVLRAGLGSDIDGGDYDDSQVLSRAPGTLTLGYEDGGEFSRNSQELAQKYGNHVVSSRSATLADAYLRLGLVARKKDLKE